MQLEKVLYFDIRSLFSSQKWVSNHSGKIKEKTTKPKKHIEKGRKTKNKASKRNENYEISIKLNNSLKKTLIHMPYGPNMHEEQTWSII